MPGSVGKADEAGGGRGGAAGGGNVRRGGGGGGGRSSGSEPSESKSASMVCGRRAGAGASPSLSSSAKLTSPELSLAEALDPAMVETYQRKATGVKYLIPPAKGL